MPMKIPIRSKVLCSSIPEQSLDETETEEAVEENHGTAGRVYEVSDVPMTPDESLLNQVILLTALLSIKNKSEALQQVRMHRMFRS